MRAEWAWRIFGNRPCRLCLTGITIWSFLCSAIHTDRVPAADLRAISPPSIFSPICGVVETATGCRLECDKKILLEKSKDEITFFTLSLLMTKALEGKYNTRESRKIAGLYGIEGLSAAKIGKEDGIYVVCRKNKRSPQRILHYFLDVKDARAAIYAPIDFEGHRRVFVETLTPGGYEEVKKNRIPRVFFSPEGGCRQELIDAIDEADEEISAAVYSFTDEAIEEALVRAVARGIKVKIFLDKGQKNKASLKLLKKCKKAEIKYDAKSGLMHNKFIVIDKKTVLSGSYNWTTEAEKLNRENLIILPYLNEFRVEFERLWNGGAASVPTARSPPARHGVKALFSPRGQCEKEIIDAIKKTAAEKRTDPRHEHRIDIALYYFTNRDIAKELFCAKEAGVNVNILLDKCQIGRKDAIEKYLRDIEEKTRLSEERRGFRNCNRGRLEIRYYRMPDGTMHNKFAIIGKTTFTGSFNWTAAAEKRNRENLIVIPFPSEDYAKEFLRLWKDVYETALIDEGETAPYIPRAPPESFENGIFYIYKATRDINFRRAFNYPPAEGKSGFENGQWCAEAGLFTGPPDEIIKLLALDKKFNNACGAGDLTIKEGAIFVFGPIADAKKLKGCAPDQIYLDRIEIEKGNIVYCMDEIIIWSPGKGWIRLKRFSFSVFRYIIRA